MAMRNRRKVVEEVKCERTYDLTKPEQAAAFKLNNQKSIVSLDDYFKTKKHKYCDDDFRSHYINDKY